MTVNLGRTDCRFCGGEVLLDEEPRRLTAGEATLLPEHLRRALVANATCFECSAEYIAWFETDTLARLSDTPHSAESFPLSATSFFRDLSHRSTMTSEPGEADLPMHVIDQVRIKRTWPTCLGCGKRIFEGRGCQCPEPEPLRIVVRPLLVIPEWRSSFEFAITTYDLFVPLPTEIVGDEDEWASLRTLLEISYLVSLEAEVRAIEEDLREHWIEVTLPPAGDCAYRGDDRHYHAFIESIVNRASLAVDAETLKFELTPETPLDGGAGPWVNPKSRYILQPSRDEYHWMAAFAWAYSKLPHHWIHIMQEQVEAFRGRRGSEGTSAYIPLPVGTAPPSPTAPPVTNEPPQDGTGIQGDQATTERWWVSFEDLKLVRPIAYCERDLPLGFQIGGLFIVDGAAFVTEDKRAPRMIKNDEAPPQSSLDPEPPDPAPDGVDWPATTLTAQYPSYPTIVPKGNIGQPVQQFPNPSRTGPP